MKRRITAPSTRTHLTERCAMRAGHGGEHLWVTTEAFPILGECNALPPLANDDMVRRLAANGNVFAKQLVEAK